MYPAAEIEKAFNTLERNPMPLGYTKGQAISVANGRITVETTGENATTVFAYAEENTTLIVEATAWNELTVQED